MKSCKMPVPEVFGVIDNGKYYDVNYNELAENDICSNIDFFIKESEGECASFVKHINSWDELKFYQD